MKATSFKFSVIVLMAMVVAFSSCKKNFDEPPIAELPNIESNMTIAQLIALATVSPSAIDSSKIIEGVVVGDDRTGNFYKQLVIQDSTGGIRIDIDAYDIYNDFPVGRRVYVRLAGLYIWQDGDVPALVGSSDPNNSRIPQALYKNYIVGGEYNQTVTPQLRTISTLTAADYHTLIQLDSVEFTASFAGQTYADVVTQFSVNAELHECTSGGTIIVRNSGFATFAGELMPTGNGSIVAVYNSFGGTRQLFIRDTDDLTMEDSRCTFLPGANATLMPIDSVRMLFTGFPTMGPMNRKINGIVISDKDNGNFQTKNIVLQELNGSGIVVRFTSNHTFSQGDEVEIDISGQEISEYSGLMQLNNVPLSYAIYKSANNSLTPRVATIADINANSEAWESTLVKVMNVSLSGSSTYAYNVTMDDGTSTINMFTSPFATFATASVPTDTGDVTGIVGQFTTTQINIRNLTDVNITSTGGGGGNLSVMPIDSVKMLYSGTPVFAPAGRSITGIVISDYVNANMTGRNLAIQTTGGSGIVVRFDANHTFNMGDSVEIDISGIEISEYAQVVQLNNTPTSNCVVKSTGNTMTPRVATIAQINTNSEAWESTLVQVAGATISGGATYGTGGVNINDGTGTIDLYTRTAATFSGDAVPSGSKTVTGIVSQFNATKQITMRTSADVQ